MKSETRIIIGLIASLVLCCAGPLALSLLGSGAVLSALSGTVADVRPLLTGIGALVVTIGIVVLAATARSRGRDHGHMNTSIAHESPPTLRVR